MLCQELMKTDIECISPETTVEDAAARMREANIGFLPVCDDTRKVLGTITDRDIVIRVVASRESPEQPVENFLIPRIVACRTTDNLADAEELMSREKVSRILCINERGELEGVLSLSDIAQIEDSARVSATLKSVTQREARGGAGVSQR
jgi:CBS domain-containing protein